MDIPPHGGWGQQPVPIPPLHVVVVISTVLLVDDVVVDWVVVVFGTLVVVGAMLVVVVGRAVVGEGGVVIVELTGGTTGGVVGGGGSVAGGGLVGARVVEGLAGTAGDNVEDVVAGGILRFGDGPVPEGTLIDDEGVGPGPGLVMTVDGVGETGGGARGAGVDRRAGA